jgi:DNA-binding GntR family transcriptional regulator
MEPMSTPETVLSSREQIVNQLRGEIFGGVLRAGEPLREMSLARQFGVSRGPVRQALQELTREGLLVARSNCGVTVAGTASDEVRDLFTPMRAMIETYALNVSFDALTEADVRAWDRRLKLLRLACEDGDYPAILRHDFEFHRSIVLRAGGEDLVPVWTLIMTRVKPYPEWLSRWKRSQARKRGGGDAANDPMEIHAIHSELVAVLRSGDKAAAMSALSDHIQGERDGSCRDRS